MSLVPPMQQPAGAAAAVSAPAGAGTASLPDINSETYPFGVVQQILDEAAYFNFYSTPDLSRCRPIPDPRNASTIIGFQVGETVCRFSITMSPPSVDRGFTSWAMLGEPVARFDHRWLFVPDDFAALPDREPPPVAFDPARHQRFVMLDSILLLGRGRDGFHGFGTGSTYPATVNGRKQLLAGAVGTILDGFGRFSGHEGTYTYCGSLSEKRGYMGNLLLRVVDPEATLFIKSDLQPLRPMADPEPAITYMIFRGQKRDHLQKTAYVFGPNGDVVGLDVNQQLRLMQIDCGSYGKEISSVAKIGPVIGEMNAKITFNLLHPGAPGTGTSPIPFKSYNTYQFLSREGKEVGVVEADGGEGRTFTLSLPRAPGQQALRFGGFGPIRKGTGAFEGIEGFMTDNSVVGIAPHALATLYVLRVHDPEGKYRTTDIIA